jgi:hypothetical protein
LAGFSFFHRAGGNHLGAQAIVFVFRTVAPVNAVRLGQRSNLSHPIDEFLMFDVSWDVECGDAAHHGLVHGIPPNAN